MLLRDDAVFVGASQKPEYLLLQRANRHGLVTGATGTGKTVTLQILAEGFSRAGVPVFCADIKGDLSGISMPGAPKDFLAKRAADIGLSDEYAFAPSPVAFWDLFGAEGHPIRTTVSEMGPLLLSRLMDLTDAQEGVLNIVFRLADDQGLLLLDLKDLRALVAHVGEQASELSQLYGNVSKASVGAIQRRLLVLEEQGGDAFFGEPALAIADLMRTDPQTGRGVVNVLAADRLMTSPRLYATFLLWLLSELFEEMPEVGDPDKPKLVFFFDEAHLLFDEAPKALLQKVEQVVRLIRSKGIGVYFVSQSPLDVPDEVLGQLGNRVQHALRAFTPRDQKAVRAAAETFRPNPELDTAQAIMELGVGEALVSTLDAKGIPSVVERTLVRPPSGRLGPIGPAERQAILAASPLGAKYDTAVDRVSAYEILTRKAEETVQTAEEGTVAPEPDQPEAVEKAESGGLFGGMLGQLFGTGSDRGARLTTTQRVARSVARTISNQVAGEIGRQIGGRTGSSVSRAVVRGVLGGMLRR
ncbi:helicase HerA-like domain-containing protein [Amorphus orientalis]|uniref:DNA helicase HerA-like ATPase n=1 Tax=Amorphus orientalis TaxID=649198 RepID=A0AAE4AUF1_9HYPH|nr:helicase HerA-like domain-containing protein [Amorphus orientalis]MDQ0317325.1 DNA helicase HerA-like ATPase [Amorphus orientalis]